VTLALCLALAAQPLPQETGAGAPGAASREWGNALAALPDGAGLRPGDRQALAQALAGMGPAAPRVDASPARWAERLWDWFLDLLGTPEAERYAAGGRLAFLGAFAAASFAAWWFWRRPRRRETPAPAWRPAPAERPPDPEEADARAAEALGRARTAEALRLALLSALQALEVAGHLPRRPDLTNRELSRELATRASAPPGALAEWQWLALRHELAVYGGAPVGEAEAREALARSRALRRALARATP